MMDDGFWASVSKWFNEKTSSPLYITYILFFIIWNWKFFQIIFLEDKALFSAPRVEYIASELIFSAPLNLSKKLLFAQPFVDFIANTVWHLVPPALFTVLAIIFLPRAHEWALRIYLNGYFSRKNIYHEASIKYEKNKTKELEVRATEKTKQAKQRQVIEKSQTQEEKWEEEFLNFKLHPLYQKLTQIIHALYNKGGKTRERMMGEVYICLLMRIFSPSRTQMV